ncbi:hypothetical protein GE21DRAFT_1068535 [Neurospora crassa]|nr:hypothetical protein GE21DRAFT_1068535 [Neurospora crassa]
MRLWARRWWCPARLPRGPAALRQWIEAGRMDEVLQRKTGESTLSQGTAAPHCSGSPPKRKSGQPAGIHSPEPKRRSGGKGSLWLFPPTHPHPHPHTADYGHPDLPILFSLVLILSPGIEVPS